MRARVFTVFCEPTKARDFWYRIIDTNMVVCQQKVHVLMDLFQGFKIKFYWNKVTCVRIGTITVEFGCDQTERCYLVGVGGTRCTPTDRVAWLWEVNMVGILVIGSYIYHLDVVANTMQINVKWIQSSSTYYSPILIVHTYESFTSITCVPQISSSTM